MTIKNSNMHILHISNDFGNTKVHANLLKQLDVLGIEQTIFNPIPISRRNSIGRNEFEAERTKFVYADVVKPFHHYSYHLKEMAIFKSLKRTVDLRDVSLCHASTLVSDGGIANKIYKKYHIPYIVAVRVTDYSSFLLKAPQVWLDIKAILLNASRIVFVSPALKTKFCEHFFIKRFVSRIEDKIMISRNGVDNYWTDNVNRISVPINHDILYVGSMIRRKHPLTLIEAVLELREKYPDIKLNLIGSSGGDEDAVKEYANNNPDVIIYHGQINSKQELMDNYRKNSIFALPSISETFGLVYLEALSQNLPVIYTKGEGIDGFLSDCNGVGISTPSVENIKNAIKKIFNNRRFYTNSDIDFEFFRWSKIASDYVTIYNQILCEK